MDITGFTKSQRGPRGSRSPAKLVEQDLSFQSAMSTNQEVRDRERQLKAIFSKHATFLSSWDGTQNFKRNYHGRFAPWGRMAPGALLNKLLGDEHLIKQCGRKVPGQEVILSALNASQFEEIIDWLDTALYRAAALQEINTAWETSSTTESLDGEFSFPAKSESSHQPSGTANVVISVIPREEREWSEEILSDASITRLSSGAIDLRQEPQARNTSERVKELNEILAPISSYVRDWILKQTCVRQLSRLQRTSYPIYLHRGI